MSNFTLRPAVREDTPLIVGLAGPTKSGKTKSAHRIAAGMASFLGGAVAMLNAEGKRGHQYADTYKYLGMDIRPPFSPARYNEALLEIKKAKPAVLIIDSLSHMHDGPGGMLEQHDTVMTRMAGDKIGKARDAYTWAAWAEVKKPENEFIYTMLDLDIPIIGCFRAKEKLKIVRGKDPIDLGFQPIASDRVAFETMFTLMLPPHSKGVPDLEQSEMREPFDTLIPFDRALDESLGVALATWAAGRPKVAVGTGAGAGAPPDAPATPSAGSGPTVDEALLIKAREWAESGTDKYAAFWGTLTAEQRRGIGAVQHEKFKAIAAKVPA